MTDCWFGTNTWCLRGENICWDPRETHSQFHDHHWNNTTSKSIGFVHLQQPSIIREFILGTMGERREYNMDRIPAQWRAPCTHFHTHLHHGWTVGGKKEPGVTPYAQDVNVQNSRKTSKLRSKAGILELELAAATPCRLTLSLKVSFCRWWLKWLRHLIVHQKVGGSTPSTPKLPWARPFTVRILYQSWLCALTTTSKSLDMQSKEFHCPVKL